ncbi:uncharacterized protein LOC109862636 [Pseudomyrmex gracilis]|uniref:uncharacterized protein LOC109862636 n=1 Tax=Pseudomyrmex gracilis TaxID=219809 RepID=UPI000995A002|nr:uncharacterized protein LOC109862636 [Pseudomyrmex gracilis]
MSLVAYESSDESSENEENEKSEETLAANNANNDANKTVTVRTNVKLSLPAPKTVLQETNDEELENVESGSFQHFLDLLPKPKVSNSVAQIVEEDDDIVVKKEIKSQIVKPAKKQTVKISVPSLSEFKDLEEDKESEKKPASVTQPSQKTCGLFAVLVPPKEKTTNNKSLIPQVVKNTLRSNVQQPKAAKKSSTSLMNDSKIKNPVISDKTHSELSSDDEDNETVDFFGLTASNPVSDTSDSSVSELSLHKLSTDEASLANHTDHTTQNSDILKDSQANSTSKILISNVINLPKEEILLKNKAEVGPKLPVPEQEYNIDMEGNVAFDEKAIEYLCGKRGIKRKEMDEANIIEINGEDIKPDEREWLVKALTEEPVHRPISMQSCGINSQSKKKHQITYLAHQAKAMELELKNQWSQNRMTRKQTQSKYGF